jgi:hypothetical protein
MAYAADGWRRSFADQSQSEFAEQLADEIVLEATTLTKPIEGKPSAAIVLATASSIYESLEFTDEAQSASTTCLHWRATAFGGMKIEGVTVLERDPSGKIVADAIHRCPPGPVLRFSAELRDRLAGVIPARILSQGDNMDAPSLCKYCVTEQIPQSGRGPLRNGSTPMLSSVTSPLLGG